MSTLQIVTVGWRRMFVLGAARNTLTVNHSPTAVPSAVESITVMVEEDGCSDTGDVHTTHTLTVPLFSVAAYSILSNVYMKPSGKMSYIICINSKTSQINSPTVNASMS